MENNLNFDFKDGTLYVSLIGEIDYHSAASTREAIDEKILELCPKNLVLDLADAPFMDSSGFGLIMGRYQLMKDLGGTHAIANPSAGHQKIFELAGLNKLIKYTKK